MALEEAIRFYENLTKYLKKKNPNCSESSAPNKTLVIAAWPEAMIFKQTTYSYSHSTLFLVLVSLHNVENIFYPAI